MIKNDTIINAIAYGDILHRIAAERNVGLTEAKLILEEMSFREYKNFIDEAGSAIVPPSGNTISPTSQPNTQQNKPAAPAKATWAGKGSPLGVGMTVGLKGPNNVPIPGEVSQVDTSGNGAKIKDPTTGKVEWVNIDDLEPFMASTQGQPTQEGQDIARMRQLAGISENCSAGATGAGAIAIAPTSMGTVKRRQSAEEALTPEYTRKTAAKTVIGDTKPNQASGKLSADLAASGKRTARRPNSHVKK